MTLRVISYHIGTLKVAIAYNSTRCPGSVIQNRAPTGRTLLRVEFLKILLLKKNTLCPSYPTNGYVLENPVLVSLYGIK